VKINCKTILSYDVGVAGIHRLYPELSKLLTPTCSLSLLAERGPSTIIAGLTDIPVIGVRSPPGTV